MKPIRKFHKFLTNQKFLFRMSSNSQSESNLPKALAADLKKFDKAELQKTKTEEKVLTPSLAAAGKPIKSKFFRRCVFEPDQKFEPNIFFRFVFRNSGPVRTNLILPCEQLRYGSPSKNPDIKTPIVVKNDY